MKIQSSPAHPWCWRKVRWSLAACRTFSECFKAKQQGGILLNNRSSGGRSDWFEKRKKKHYWHPFSEAEIFTLAGRWVQKLDCASRVQKKSFWSFQSLRLNRDIFPFLLLFYLLNQVPVYFSCLRECCTSVFFMENCRNVLRTMTFQLAWWWSDHDFFEVLFPKIEENSCDKS